MNLQMAIPEIDRGIRFGTGNGRVGYPGLPELHGFCSRLGEGIRFAGIRLGHPGYGGRGLLQRVGGGNRFDGIRLRRSG